MIYKDKIIYLGRGAVMGGETETPLIEGKCNTCENYYSLESKRLKLVSYTIKCSSQDLLITDIYSFKQGSEGVGDSNTLARLIWLEGGGEPSLKGIISTMSTSLTSPWGRGRGI